MIVVSDASVLVNLDRIGRGRLLSEIFGRVAVPVAVAREARRSRPQWQETFPDWVEIRPVSDRVRVAQLAKNLDAGESEAIALALEMRADFLLIDESLGRTAAVRLGIRIMGLLGVLLVAKQRRLISAVGPEIDRLKEMGFWLAEDLVVRVLAQAGETPR